LPGPKQVFRYADRQGTYLRDVIGCADEAPAAGGIPLLRDFMKNGRLLDSAPSLQSLRDNFRVWYASLPERHKALISPEPYDVQLSPKLSSLTRKTVSATRQREGDRAGEELPKS
jgi:hypothetical protein